MELPRHFEAMASLAWRRAAAVTGFLGETETRALCMLAAVAIHPGVIVEIGSFKGRSTLALATIAERLGLEPVVSIDPHNSPSPTDPGGDSYAAFLDGLKASGLEAMVESHRATSRTVAANWNRPIRLLWIDGDHTYAGAREDLTLYAPFLGEGSIVALHDTLHFFEGPIRVFVEDVLRSDEYGPAGFLHSIGWAQRRHDGRRFRGPRQALARRASRLVRLVTPPRQNRGLTKLRHKLSLARVPHRVPAAAEWAAGLD